MPEGLIKLSNACFTFNAITVDKIAFDFDAFVTWP